jgi:hypothetical protein
MAWHFAAGDNIRWLENLNQMVQGTVAFWLKTTSTTANIVLASNWSGSSRNGWGIILNNPSAGKIALAGYDAGTDRLAFASTSANLNNGNWRHIAFCWDRHQDVTNKIYVDGILENSVTSSNVWGVGVTATLYEFARIRDAFWGSLVGDMQELGLWGDNSGAAANFQLNATEIAALAKGVSPKLIRPSKLLLHAPFLNGTHETHRNMAVNNLTGGSLSIHNRTLGAGF